MRVTQCVVFCVDVLRDFVHISCLPGVEGSLERDCMKLHVGISR